MFLHLERIWLEVIFFEVSLMQTWQWVAFEVAGTNTINTFLFLFPLSPLYLSLSCRKKNSIFTSRTSIYGICPECRKIQTYAWRGNNSGANQIARKPEVMRNRVTALKLLRCFFMNKWHMKVSYYEKLKISRANLAQRWLSDEEFMRLNENMSGCASWEEDWTPLKAMWLSRFQAANVCFANSIFVVLF